MIKKASLLLLLVSLSALISACSSDDDSTNPETSTLVRVEQSILENGVLDEKIVMDFNNQKPVRWSFYNATNQLMFFSEWNYNSNGALATIKGYLADGTLDNQLTITYDSSNRITQTTRSEENNTFIATTNFIHNNDNTITSNSNSIGNNTTKTFEVNANGIIDKEIFNGNTVAFVTYNNLNPITKTTSFNTYNYTYLSNGSTPFNFQNVFGANPINAVLFQNSLDDSSDLLATGLVTEITSDTSNQEFVYTLNDDNLPLTRKDYYNGVLDNELDYFYE